MSQNRIDQCFSQLQQQGEKAFVAYITAGDPNIQATLDLMHLLENCGVDILELGVPFSDPIGDGPVNQAAAERALESKTTLKAVLDCVSSFRKKSNLPVVLFSYMNPLHDFGYEKLGDVARRAGVDGILTVDGPFDMHKRLRKILVANHLRSIYLAAPTTTGERLRQICRHSGGFIYLVSSMGVTGVRQSFANSIPKRIETIRQLSQTPVCVGFGIGEPKQAKKMAGLADGVIVGSGLVQRVAQFGKNSARLHQELAGYTRSMVEAVKSVKASSKI